MAKTINVCIAGLGGQGVLTASDLVAEIAFRSELDVKKSEVHGMSQRGGSVNSDVRFGERVASPMISEGEADFLVVLDETQIEVNRHRLKPDGILIVPSSIPEGKLANPKSLNVALLGVLSKHLEFPESLWMAVLREFLPAKILAVNEESFRLGRL
ncbi:MAG: pyruvate ferredoxin oxidoreductase [Lentisphaerae bacterium GWF2_52_8]|nr:MAG: pyruvate ferredoxin oxidoreductase [Lentisphaerae bacterium GWF2_52_8]